MQRSTAPAPVGRHAVFQPAASTVKITTVPPPPTSNRGLLRPTSFNTCWMNTLIQLTASSTPIYNMLLESEAQKPSVRATLIEVEDLMDESSALRTPDTLIDALESSTRSSGAMFSRYNQEDVGEVWHEVWGDVATQAVETMLQQDVRCLTCGQTSTTVQTTSTLTPFLGSGLVKGLNDLVKATEVERRCASPDGCDGRRAIYSLRVLSVPEALVIAPKSLDPQLRKIAAPSQLPDSIAIGTPSGLVHFRIRATAYHFGATGSSGHYVCVRRGDDEKIRLFDDAKVEEVSSFDEIGQQPDSTPALVIYERGDTLPVTTSDLRLPVSSASRPPLAVKSNNSQRVVAPPTTHWSNASSAASRPSTPSLTGTDKRPHLRGPIPSFQPLAAKPDSARPAAADLSSRPLVSRSPRGGVSGAGGESAASERIVTLLDDQDAFSIVMGGNDELPSAADLVAFETARQLLANDLPSSAKPAEAPAISRLSLAHVTRGLIDMAARRYALTWRLKLTRAFAEDVLVAASKILGVDDVEKALADFCFATAGTAPNLDRSRGEVFANQTTASQFTPRKLPPAVRDRFQSLTCAISLRQRSSQKPKPPAKQPSPFQLHSDFSRLLAQIACAKPPAHDLEAFERARRTRKKHLNELTSHRGLHARPSWGAANTEDVARLPLFKQLGLPRLGAFSDSLATYDALLLLTFPVSGENSSMLAHETSSSESFRPCSTALRVDDWVRLLMPSLSSRLLWIDSVPLPRPAKERTDSRDPAQHEAFLATLKMIQRLDLKVIIAMQEANRAWLEDVLPPTHVRNNMPDVSAASLQAGADAFDKFWGWYFDDDEVPRGYRQITKEEAAAWAHLNLLDAGEHELLPQESFRDETNRAFLRPNPSLPAIFVRRFLGRQDCLLVFAPHICTTDPIFYSCETFLASCRALEVLGRTLQAIVEGTRLSIPEPRGSLEARYAIPEFDRIYAGSIAQDRSIITTLRGIRRLEILNRRAFLLSELSPALQRIISRWLTSSEDPASLASITLTSRPSGPPSLVSEALATLSQRTLRALAKAEADAEAGTIGPSDLQFRILEDARASSSWKTRLRELGVPEWSEAMRFRRALEKYKLTETPYDATFRRHKALQQAGEGAVLVWSPHFAQSTTAIQRGHLVAGGDFNNRRYGFKDLRWRPSPRCDRVPTTCTQLGLSACVVSYTEAITTGAIFSACTAADVTKNLEGWQDALAYEESTYAITRPDRSELRVQIEDCQIFMAERESGSDLFEVCSKDHGQQK